MLDFKNNIRMHVLGKAEYLFEFDGTRHEVVIDMQFIYDITGESSNRNDQSQDIGKCANADLDKLINNVAPYRDTKKHFKYRIKSLETNRLQ